MNGIATITIAGHAVGLKFGMPAVRRFFEKTKDQTTENPLLIGGQYTDFGLVHLLYAGYVNDRLMKDQPVALPFEAFYEFIESAADEGQSKEEVLTAVGAFEASRYVKPIVAEIEEKKKALMKLPGMNSNLSAMETSGTRQENTTASRGGNTSLAAADSIPGDQENMNTPD